MWSLCAPDSGAILKKTESRSVKEMYLIGIDIGGTKCAVSLGKIKTAPARRISGENASGNGALAAAIPEILAKTQFPTQGPPEAVLEKCKNEMDAILQKAGLSYQDAAGIGISCGGPLDTTRGEILSPPNLPGWDRIPVVSFFETQTGLKTRLQNDANACAAAEWMFGAGRGTQNMIFLTFGTGLGAGLILNGSLYSGTCDLAGEAGHLRLASDGPRGYGKAGSAEGFCSGGGITRAGIAAVKYAIEQGETPLLLQRAGSMERITAKLIAELAYEGDPLCLRIYRVCGQQLGKLLGMLIDLLNPERIMIGGIFARCRDLIEPEMYAVLKQEALQPASAACRILPAALGEEIGDYAALSAAAYGFFSSGVMDSDLPAPWLRERLFSRRPSAVMQVLPIYAELLQRYPQLQVCGNHIFEAFLLLAETFENGGRVLCCGNGGSCADSDHLVGELMKSFRFRRALPPALQRRLAKSPYQESRKLAEGLEGALPVVSLCNHAALISAFSNDNDPRLVFAQQINGLGREGDLLLAFSTSGNSENCVYAAAAAKSLGLRVISFTGQSDSRLSGMADTAVQVPEIETYRIQELHLPVYHALCAMTEAYFFTERK